MAVNLDISAGWVNGRHRILGRHLRPYSAAHAFALATGGWEGVATIGGILGFLRICARPVRNAVPAGFPDLPPTLGDVFRALVLSLSPRLRARVCDEVRDYLRDYNTSPQVDFPTVQQVSEPFSGSDFVALVVRGVQSGLTYDQAWSMPLGALQTWVAHVDLLTTDPHVSRGKIRNPEDERAFLEWQAAQEKEAANG